MKSIPFFTVITEAILFLASGKVLPSYRPKVKRNRTVEEPVGVVTNIKKYAVSE
jgi:hypothetical protein